MESPRVDDSGALRLLLLPLGKVVIVLVPTWLGGWDAIPFLRSCRGTRRTRTLRFSLLRCGERPGRHPDVASGGYSYPAPARLSASCGGAVSSVVTSGCPKRSEGGFPVGTRTITAFPSGANMQSQTERRIPSEPRENARGAASHTGDSASFVRSGSAEELSPPRRTQPGSAHARERRQPDRGWPS